MGTQLMLHGLAWGGCAELWNLERPDQVLEVHRAYCAAGADIVLANTFGANRSRLARHGLEGRMHELNRAGMELAREAAGPDRLVLGDVGPSGAAPDRSLDAVFAEQIEALAEAGADGILIETIPSLAELEWAVRAARRVCALPLVASVFFVNRPHGPCTAAGEQCGLVARRAADWGADVVGANCGAGMRQLVDVLPRMRAVTAMPLAARPSAGLPRVQEGTAYYPESAADFTALLPELCRAGPVLVGGCCGTTPEHIRAIRTFVDRAAAPLCG